MSDDLNTFLITVAAALVFVLQGEVGDVWSLFLFLLSSLSSSTDLLSFFRLFLVAHFLSFLCTCSRFSWKPLSLSLCSITSFHHRSLFLSLSHCVTCLRSLMCPDVKGEATERDAARPHWAFLKSRVILGEDGETGLNVAATPELRTSLGWQM